MAPRKCDGEWAPPAVRALSFAFDYAPLSRNSLRTLSVFANSFGHGQEALVKDETGLGIGKTSGGDGATVGAAASTSPVFSKNGGSWGEKTAMGVKISSLSSRRVFASIKYQADTAKSLDDAPVLASVDPKTFDLPYAELKVATWTDRNTDGASVIFLSDLVQESPINIHDELNTLLGGEPGPGTAGGNGLFLGDTRRASDRTKFKYDQIDFSQQQTQIEYVRLLYSHTASRSSSKQQQQQQQQFFGSVLVFCPF